MVERAVGQEALFQEAVEIAVGDAYQHALVEHQLQPLTQPDINLTDTQNEPPDPTRPLRFTATVQVQPPVTLGDYAHLRVGLPSMEVNPEEIEGVLNRLQEEQAPWQAVDDLPAESGNQVTIAIKATIDDETLIDQPSFEYVVRADESAFLPIPELSQHLLGSTVGQEIAYDVLLPEGYRPEEFAGKTMHVAMNVLNIERKSLPELDDDFAKTLGSFESLDEVRESIKATMANTKQRQMMDEYVTEVVRQVVDQAQVDVPDVLVEEELDRAIAEMRSEIESGRRMTLDQYLRIVGKTPEDLRQEMRAAAEVRVRSNLVLDEVGRQENVEAPAEEVEQELLAMAGLPTLKNRTKRRVMTSPEVRERVATRIRRRYTMLRLLQLVAVTPTDEAGTAELETGTFAQIAAPEGEMTASPDDMPATATA